MSLNIEKFTEGYLVCALWSSTDENGEPLDRDYSPTDISADCAKQMREDCADFVQANAADLTEYCIVRDEDYAGHDFWLTRNGHGAGFWDRGLGELGQRLSKAAKVCGGVDLYVGDDGLIYC